MKILFESSQQLLNSFPTRSPFEPGVRAGLELPLILRPLGPATDGY